MAYTLSDSSVWNKRHKIAKSTDTYISGNLTDFTLLVKIDSNARWNDFWANVDSTEGYVQFTDSGGETVQKFEIEDWDTTNTEAIFWVKASSALAAADTELYLYFDYVSGGSAPFDDKENAWDATHISVWHMNEDKAEGAFDDSTSNNHDLTNSGTTSIVGEVGKGLDFDGTDDFVSAADHADWILGNDFAISLWCDTTDINTSERSHLFAQFDDTDNYWRFGLYDIPSSPAFSVTVKSSGSILVNEVPAWAGYTDAVHYVVLRRISTDWYVYVDSVLKATITDSVAVPDIAAVVMLGAIIPAAPVEELDGMLDEYRVHSTSRTVEWFDLSYHDINNADDWTTYQTLSAMEGALEKAVTAGITLAASLARSVSKPLTAGLTLAAASAKSVTRSVTAGLTLAAAKSVAVTKSVTAGLTLAASISRAVAKSVTAGLTLAATSSRAAAKSLTAGLTLSGTVSRSVAVTKTAGFTLAASVGRAVTKPLTAGFTLAATAYRGFNKAVTAGLTLAATTAMSVTKSVSAGFTLTAAAIRGFNKNVSAGFTLAGTQAMAVTKSLAAGLTLAGVKSVAVGKRMSAGFTLAASTTRAVGASFTAGFTLAASLLRGVAVTLTAGFTLLASFTSIVQRRIIRPLSGTMGSGRPRRVDVDTSRPDVADMTSSRPRRGKIE